MAIGCTVRIRRRREKGKAQLLLGPAHHVHKASGEEFVVSPSSLKPSFCFCIIRVPTSGSLYRFTSADT